MIALTASPNPAAIGQPVAFSLFVDSLSPSQWWPSGVLSSAVDGQAVPGAITLDGDGSTSASRGRSRPPASTTSRRTSRATTDFLAADAALDETITGPATTQPCTQPTTKPAGAPRPAGCH